MENSQKPSKRKVVAYIFGGLFILGGLGMLTSGEILSGIFSVIAGTLTLPTFWKYLDNKYSFRLPTGLKIISVIFVLFLVGATTEPKQNSINQTPQETVSTTATKRDEENSKREIPEYQIIGTTTERYDNNLTYRILIDPVDLSNTKFKEDVKAIIADLVDKHGERISVDIFDSMDAYTALLEKTDTNRGCIYDEKGTLVTDTAKVKSCLEKLTSRMERNYIAFYVGRLDKDNPYWLSYFPSSFKDTDTVGKYVGSENFNPKEYNK